MKRHSLYTKGRFALTAAAFAAMSLVTSYASALGLGRLAVQSSLGETLRAEIDITSITPEEASNLVIKVAPPESYRAAGVDYNAVLPTTQVSVQRTADGRQFISLTSNRSVQEPFVDIILEISWSTGRLVREYTLLFDPPSTRTAAGATTSAAITPAPAPRTTGTNPLLEAASPPPAPRVTAERRAPAPRAPATGEPPEPRRAAPPRAPAVASTTPPAPQREAGSDEYKVRQGDSLSRIAGRVQRPGVSLDQMLAALYQANPQAFSRDNINRLKAGVVLAVPKADEAKAITPSDARQLIQAQSSDFGTYRQKLASAVPAAKTEGSSRQTSGKVQSSVDDRKASTAATPDKLTLSKGGAKGASAPEERLSKDREKKDVTNRVTELSKNVDELKKLSSASAAASRDASTSGTGSKAPSLPAVVPPVATATPPVAPPAPTPAPVPPAPPPAPVVAITPPAPAPVAEPASAPTAVVAAPVAAASEPASAPVAVASASQPAAASAPVLPPAEAPSGSFLDDNPLVLAAGAALIALLAGFGIYRFTKRAKKDSGETSFLESRLQPDSFFGASGGQRVDTRDASTAASSSMSYSLSQLDAIGDVDPVAEADVYLAYGRDLQAEEILKEAMRASPERLAIRTKLLEVYAKRRDTKGFELLATQLFGLTGGQGEDWAKAQEIGLQIDPDNTMYQPGGKPATATESGGRPTAELLGASTMPQSVLPASSEFGASGQGSGFDTTTGSGIDLDLDLALPDTAPAPITKANERTQPISPAAPDSQSSSMGFDLDSISLDLGPEDSAGIVEQPPAAKDAKLVSTDFGSLDVGNPTDDSDPLARKLELAQEFAHIGDAEGARDLLQEVISKGSGPLKARAQGLLNDLSK